MTTIGSQITSLAFVYSTAYSDADQRKHHAPRHWPLCGEFTGTGEFPAQMASYAETVSIWWRHHDSIWHQTEWGKALHWFQLYLLGNIHLEIDYYLWIDKILQINGVKQQQISHESVETEDKFIEARKMMYNHVIIVYNQQVVSFPFQSNNKLNHQWAYSKLSNKN